MPENPAEIRINHEDADENVEFMIKRVLERNIV